MTPPTPRGRQPLPTSANAMLATLTEDRFSDPNWLFEPNWDGERCLAFRTKAGQVRLRSRNDKPLEGTFPEIADAVSRHCQVAAVLDGEVVAFTGRRTSFERLQGRMGLTDPVPAQATGIAVVYCVFDVLYLDGDDLRSRPLRERKRLLRDAVNFTAPLRFTPHRNTTGEDEYRKACARGDEGVIAKRADSPYTGGRSKDWLKFKCVRDQELVVGGYTAPKGSRTGFGALLVGYYDGADFVYAGKVGTDLALRPGADSRERRALGATPDRRPDRLLGMDPRWIAAASALHGTARRQGRPRRRAREPMRPVRAWPSATRGRTDETARPGVRSRRCSSATLSLPG
jgi:bifunctional non-homologous end joining protein LigD